MISINLSSWSTDCSINFLGFYITILFESLLKVWWMNRSWGTDVMKGREVQYSKIFVIDRGPFQSPNVNSVQTRKYMCQNIVFVIVTHWLSIYFSHLQCPPHLLLTNLWKKCDQITICSIVFVLFSNVPTFRFFLHRTRSCHFHFTLLIPYK